MPEDINIFIVLVDAIDNVIAELVDVIPFPINAAIAFIWGGIAEIVREVIF